MWQAMNETVDGHEDTQVIQPENGTLEPKYIEYQ